jgi:hypothetical protein
MSDLISRQAAIDALYDWSEHSMTDAEAWHIKQVIGDIKSLPSAQPEQRWIPFKTRRMISKQIDDLRAYAKDRKGELAKLVSDAADTIEMLSAELSAAETSDKGENKR